MEPDRQTTVRIDGPYDFVRTLRRDNVLGPSPCLRIEATHAWEAMQTPAGAAIARYDRARGSVEVRAWGPGAEWAVDRAPARLGAHDDPTAFAPDLPRLRDLARRFPGVRFGATGRPYDRLLPVVLGQRVRTERAKRSYRLLVRRHGEAPMDAPVRLPPAPERLRHLGLDALLLLDVERKRAEILIDVARRARRLDALAEVPAAEAEATLLRHRGIGPWTAALTVSSTHGDPDAVAVGDYHLPNVVAFTLAGEARADDARMLELLEPFRPRRGHAVLLLKLGGASAPRFGPRLPLRRLV